MKMEKRLYEFPLALQYYLSPPHGDGLVIALHGFQDNAASLLKRRLPVLAIHGANDERVELSRSRSEHEFIVRQGFSGKFIEVADLEHRVQSSIEPLVRAFVLKRLKGGT
jgi:hypothetical protein